MSPRQLLRRLTSSAQTVYYTYYTLRIFSLLIYIFLNVLFGNDTFILLTSWLYIYIIFLIVNKQRLLEYVFRVFFQCKVNAALG